MIQKVPNPQAVSDAETDQLWNIHDGTEPFLRSLRDRGAFEIEAIRALRRLAGCSLEQAKTVVHFSDAFSDRRERNDALHADAWRALDEAAQPELRERRLAS